MNSAKKLMTVLMAIVGLFVASLCGERNAFADGGGWIGSGTSGPSSSSSGGSGGCSTYPDSTYLLECTGYSWIYYKSTGNKYTDIYTTPYNFKKIDKACSVSGGGFWAFGRNAQGMWDVTSPHAYYADLHYVEGIEDYYSWPYTDSHNSYAASWGNWGHIETYSYGAMASTTWTKPGIKTVGTVSQSYYYDGVEVYTAQKYGTESEVLKDYKTAFRNHCSQVPQPEECGGETEYTGISFPSDLYAFCYWPEMGVKADTTFNASSKVEEVNDQSGVTEVTTNSGTAKVKFSHYIWREDDYRGNGDPNNDIGAKCKLKTSDCIPSKTQYRFYTTYSLDGGTTWSETEKTDLKTTGTMKWSWGVNDSTDMYNTYTYSNTLAAGQSVKICQRVGYYSKTKVSGSDYTYDTDSWTYSGWVCGTVKRPMPKCTLTTYAITSDDKNLNGGALLDTTTVDCNSYAEAGLGTFDPVGYTFTHNWKYYDDKANTWNDNGTGIFYTNNLDADKKAYAVYQIQKRTLTAYVKSDSNKYIKSDSTTTDTESSGWSTSDEVNYNTTATVDVGTFSPVGYSWWGWGDSCKTSERSGKKCIRNNLTSNDKVYAYYYRSDFSGRARVKAGTSLGSSPDSTGFVQTDSTKSIEIDCANDGCKAAYDLALQRNDSGTGQTPYWIGSKTNGGTTTWTPLLTNSGSAFPTSTVTGVVGSGTGTSSDSLMPGESKCHYVKFKPYGSYSNDALATVGACASAKKTEFEGQSNVTGAVTGSKGFQKTTGTTTVPISDCPSTGCKVAFNHKLKSISSTGTTSYVVYRTSNLKEGAHAISDAGNLKSGTFGGEKDKTETVYTSDELTLYPGMKVCEGVMFYPDNLKSTTDKGEKGLVAVEICAYAAGKAQPGGDDAFLNLKVMNDSVYKTYQDTVYAKPDDIVVFKATYDPKLQYTYNLVPKKMKIDNKAKLYPDGTNSAKLGPLFSAVVSLMTPNPYGAWQNGFTVTSRVGGVDRIDIDGKGSRTPGSPGYTKGDIAEQSDTNQYTVKRGDVGNTMKEKAVTNTELKTAPRQVSFNTDQTATVDTSSISSIASVIVPYNFETGISVSPKNDTASAGETNVAEISIDVKPKANALTTKGGSNDAYATKMEDASLKIIAYTPKAGQSLDGVSDYGNLDSDLCEIFRGRGVSECSSTYAGSGAGIYTFNSEGDLGGKYGESRSASFNVPDMDAGGKVCVAAAIYPSSSGGDDETEKSGSKKWRVSASKCFTITKKPSLQVWGGSVYSEKKLSTYVSEKRNIFGLSGFSINNTDRYVFGSFAELSVTGRKEVSGFASGASTGYKLNEGGTLWPSFNSNNEGSPKTTEGPGGIFETKGGFCLRSVLTFANNGCNNGTAGNLGGSGGSVISENKESLIAVFRNNQGKDNINYLKKAGDYTIEAGTELNNDIIPGVGETTVVAAINGDGVVANKDITINANIDFLDSGAGYSNLTEVPKLILYGKNIWIDCDVTRIDAVLIAEEAVVTCNNLGSEGSLEERVNAKINSEKNSKQLIINGAIIADQLVANRTYGAGKGVNSIVPAEIVNYDATLYLWGANTSDVSSTAKITTTYTRELSPRY